MPQMSPLSWLSLYIMFTIALILFCIMNYYIYLPSMMKTSVSKKYLTKSLGWKW